VILRATLAIQGCYYMITGIWPLVSMRTFEAVTGPKTEDWLVHCVGVLAAAIGLTLLAGVRGGRAGSALRETVVLSVASALAFAGIDLVYYFLGVIRWVYAADGVVQLAFVAVALFAYLRRQPPRQDDELRDGGARERARG
jgi:hypothetical protein